MEQLIVRLFFYLLSLLAWGATVVGVPGNWIILGIGVLYYFTARDYLPTAYLIALIAAALIGEILENLLGLLGAKKYGAGKKGMAGAFVGSLAGGILGSMLLPVIGTIIGVLAGAFLFTYLAEFLGEGREQREALRSAKGALLGKAAALTLKYAVGIAMLVCLFQAFFF